MSPRPNFSIIGDGLAGLMLADRLHSLGAAVEVYGDDHANTPPVALVHLFAGRTFRRSNIEIQAFERAVDHWRGEPLAQEWTVRRHIKTNDRLDRSLDHSDVPEEFKPHRIECEVVEYRPGFAIATQELRDRLRDELGTALLRQKIDPSEVPGLRILALGARAPESIPNIPWDLSGGRTVEVECTEPPVRIEVGHGLHIAPWPTSSQLRSSIPLGPRPNSTLSADPDRTSLDEQRLGASGIYETCAHERRFNASGNCETSLRQRLILGGRASATGPGPKDEVPAASALTGQSYQEIEVWEGRRCAPAADRWPVLGRTDPQTFLFCGFGSRALFWLPHCVELAALALLDPSKETDIPLSLHARRFNS